jgi:hypothetical protein
LGVAANVVEPLAKLEGQEFAKERSDTDAGVKVPCPADLVLFRLIKSINWTIKGQFHEAGEGDGSPPSHFGPNNFVQFAQFMQAGAVLAIGPADHTEFYGEDRRILQFDVRAKGIGPAPFLEQ